MTLKTNMERVINNSYKNTGGIVILKDGILQYEYYMNDCTPQTTIQVFSVTKSIVSILLGIAMDQGRIQSLDQKVLEFFPEYQVKPGEQTLQKITLRDMMTMTVPYKFRTEPYVQYFSSDDWVTAALDLIGGKGRIGEFRYAPLIGPDIFTGILTHVTGRSVLEFATEYLFEPLGIAPKSTRIFRDKEEQIAFYKEKDVNCWVAGPSGVHTGGWGLSLTAMDLAKIGQMCLNNGTWENRRIVSANWVAESTKEQSRCKERKLSYGYLWWVINEKEHAFAAMGDGGNVIYVNAKKNLVIAMASLYVPNAKIRLKLIQDYIEPVFEK